MRRQCVRIADILANGSVEDFFSGPVLSFHMATPHRLVPHSNQLEFSLDVTPSPSFSVRRVEGHIVLTPRPLALWISTTDAARMLRRSSRWVRLLCESGVITARKLPLAKKWDVDAIALQEWINSGTAQKIGQ